MLRSSLLALLAATAAATLVDATIVTITNQCGERVDLWDNKASVPLSPGESVMRDLPNGYQGMFRNGVNPQATLAEFTIDGGKFWYDISIIPTGPKSGPDYCGSLEECKAYTGGVGYNTPMQIKVGGCKTRTCLFDGCDDAYQYPKDDTKTTACGMFSPVDLIFCPGGPGGQSAPILPPITLAPVTPAPTPKPTTQAPTPEPTTQAPTPEPTTKAPTPEPTTQAPTPEPTTQAPTPEPTTAAPTPEPTTEAPAKLRSADDASSDSSSAGSRASSLESRSIGDFDTVGSGSADNSNTIGSGSAGDSNTVGSGSAGGSNTVGSGSTAAGSAFDAGDSRSEPSSGLFGTTIVLTPVRSDTVANEGDRSTGEAPKDASVQSASDQSGGVSSMLLVVLGAVGSVAGVAVFVAAKKRKEMEEETNETKDSLDSAVAFEEGDGNGLLTPIDNIQCI